MWARLQDKLLQVKKTSKTRTRRNKNARTRLCRAQARTTALEVKIAHLRVQLAPEKVPHHTYPAQMMALAIFMVVQAGASLRCAAATVEFYANLMGWPYPKPSHTTVRDWVLRCGYKSVLDTRQLVGNYVLIIDESIQIGKEKLLLLLGVRLYPDRCHSVPLTGPDVEVLGLEVQPSWTSELIQNFIKGNLALRPGVKVAYFISDRGTSILPALKSLNYDWVSDCAHEMMNIVKTLFKDDRGLSRLSAKLGSLRQQLSLAKWSGLLPPTLRDKDRFLRIFTIVKWAERMDSYWDKLPRDGRAKISFYRRAGSVLLRLRQVKELVVIASAILKTAGLSDRSRQLWQQRSRSYQAKQETMSRKAATFIKRMDAYFDQHVELFDRYLRLLCCSDIIESTFGRYKNKGGMKAISADVLSISLYNQRITTNFIQQAMKTVSCQQVFDWQNENVCHNHYGIRKRMEAELKSDTSDG
jgi:hypothetical protein